MPLGNGGSPTPRPGSRSPGATPGQDRDRLARFIVALSDVHALSLSISDIIPDQQKRLLNGRLASLWDLSLRVLEIVRDQDPGVGVVNTPAAPPAPRFVAATGVPVIPGLTDQGVFAFEANVDRMRGLKLDDAVTQLSGLRDLIKDHPALQIEVDAITRLDQAHRDLITSAVLLRPPLI